MPRYSNGNYIVRSVHEPNLFWVLSMTEVLFRKILKERNATVMNPRNKPPARPMIKRVFFLFRRVRQVLELVDSTVHCRLLNINKEIMRIYGLLSGL